jgi:hypothetical protein
MKGDSQRRAPADPGTLLSPLEEDQTGASGPLPRVSAGAVGLGLEAHLRAGQWGGDFEDMTRSGVSRSPSPQVLSPDGGP